MRQIVKKTFAVSFLLFLVFIVFIWGQRVFAQCSLLPIAPPTCPCSTTTIGDNQSLNLPGIYCYQGGEADGTIQWLQINNPDAVVIICADVDLDRVFINSGWIVVGPGVTVNYSNPWSSGINNGGIVNYGTLNLGSVFSLNPSAYIFNYGTLSGISLTATRNSQIIMGPGSSLSLSDKLSVQTNCGVCFDGAAQVSTNNVEITGGLSSALCNSTNDPACFSITSTSPSIILNSPIISDSSIQICVPNNTIRDILINSGYVDAANVSVCDCSGILPNPTISLSLQELENHVYLRWSFNLPEEVAFYTVWLSADGANYKLLDTVRNTEMYTVKPQNKTTYFVSATWTGQTIKSNYVVYTPENKPSVYFFNDLQVVECLEPVCEVTLVDLTGQIIGKYNIPYGIHPYKSIWKHIPSGQYMVIIQNKRMLVNVK
ncbi:MAG: hypothetical protein GXO48_07430 [Chlorobi bacterium]|nr:hypothetical protein [Chlorobiota bacterium]